MRSHPQSSSLHPATVTAPFPSGDAYRSWDNVAPAQYSPKAMFHSRKFEYQSRQSSDRDRPFDTTDDRTLARSPMRLHAQLAALPTAVERSTHSVAFRPPAEYLRAREEHLERLNAEGIPVDPLHQDNSHILASPNLHEPSSYVPRFVSSPRSQEPCVMNSVDQDEGRVLSPSRIALVQGGRYSHAEAQKYSFTQPSSISTAHFETTTSIDFRDPDMTGESDDVSAKALMKVNKLRGSSYGSRAPVYSPHHAGHFIPTSHVAYSSHASMNPSSSAAFLNRGIKEQTVSHHSAESGKRSRDPSTKTYAAHGAAGYSSTFHGSYANPHIL